MKVEVKIEANSREEAVRLLTKARGKLAEDMIRYPVYAPGHEDTELNEGSGRFVVRILPQE